MALRGSLGCRLLGSPPLVPSRLLKEKDNRIRSGFLGSIDCHIRRAGKKKKKKRSCDTGHRLRGETELGLFTPREGRWHLGSARWQDFGETRDKNYSPSSKPHSGTLTLHHLWHYPQSPQAMLMLITEMLITQGVTNTPYKSPHPRHREKQSRGGTHSHTQTHFTHGLHPLS